MSRHAFNSERPGKTSALCDYGNPAQWHGSVKTVIGCKSDDEVRFVGEAPGDADILITPSHRGRWLTGLSRAYKPMILCSAGCWSWRRCSVVSKKDCRGNGRPLAQSQKI